jgi:hypothetical protein
MKRFILFLVSKNAVDKECESNFLDLYHRFISSKTKATAEKRRDIVVGAIMNRISDLTKISNAISLECQVKFHETVNAFIFTKPELVCDYSYLIGGVDISKGRGPGIESYNKLEQTKITDKTVSMHKMIYDLCLVRNADRMRLVEDQVLMLEENKRITETVLNKCKNLEKTATLTEIKSNFARKSTYDNFYSLYLTMILYLFC